MSFQKIRYAQQKAWPAVRQSLEIRKAQREAVRSGATSTTAAQARARIPWNRVVADETVWALAKADLLLDDEQQAVLQAAKSWARSWDGQPPDPDEDAAEDIKLYRAVQALSASLAEIPDDIPA